PGTDDHACLFQTRYIHVIHFITMTMALVDFAAVYFEGARVRLDWATLSAFAHRATQIRRVVALFNFTFAILPFGDQGHDWMRRRRIKFRAIGATQTSDIASKFHNSQLHAQTYAQIRHTMFTGIANGLDFPFSTALAEAARNQNRIQAFQAISAFRLDNFRVEIFDRYPGLGMNACV